MATYLYIVTGFFCPKRYIRSWAWFSNCGFQCGSTKNKWFAPTKFRPTPPAVSDSNITFTHHHYNKKVFFFVFEFLTWTDELLLLKFVTISFRLSILVCPVSITNFIPRFFKCLPSIFNTVANCETTIPLSPDAINFSVMYSMIFWNWYWQENNEIIQKFNEKLTVTLELIRLSSKTGFVFNRTLDDAFETVSLSSSLESICNLLNCSSRSTSGVFSVSLSPPSNSPSSNI